MAHFYRNRPDEFADPTELMVAEQLSRLDDRWQIIWGYFFEDPGQGARVREGDFIIQGPGGQVLVMEVKGGQNRQFLLTGHWEGNPDGDNPLEQLNREWQAVLSKMQEQADGKCPWVGRALCAPNLNKLNGDRLSEAFGKSLLVTRDDLQDFEGWWKHHVARYPYNFDNPQRIFHKALLRTKRPAPFDLFIKETDRILDRYRSSSSALLDLLGANPNWIVEGGPGTGKTFLALQRAQQLAEEHEPDGRCVLFLCYNLILADQVAQLVERLKLARGRIVVKSWEALVSDILHAEGIALEIPEDPADRFRYFTQEVPGFVSTILAENPPEPTFDALVVDEAQDHDTAFEDESLGGLGWWNWYFAQLREGTRAPISIFLDIAQRPDFRKPEQFSLPALLDALPGHTRIRLNRILRYTRPIYDYLYQIDHETARPFKSLKLPETDLPTGPDVLQPISTADAPAAIESILNHWIGSKLCRIDDIVILGPRRQLADTRLGQVATLKNHPLIDYTLNAPHGHLRYLGIHRAKGLDFLAVILLDTPPDLLFPAATRTRQLLAVVNPPPK